MPASRWCDLRHRIRRAMGGAESVAELFTRANGELCCAERGHANQADGTDNGIVGAAPERTDPGLNRRYAERDGDIVHPHPLGPGEVAEGTTIRVRLTTELSTALSQVGETFKGRVASDVLQDGKVLIPAGAEIHGHVVEVSEGHAGGHGTIRLPARHGGFVGWPAVPYGRDGEDRYAGSRTRVSGEGTINAGSRWKKDGIDTAGR